MSVEPARIEEDHGVFTIEPTSQVERPVVVDTTTGELVEPDDATLVRIVDGALSRARSLAEMKAVISGLTEEQLVMLGRAAYEVFAEKARQRGDQDQLVADAFGSAFGASDGLGVMPWVDQGVLWAPGAKVGKSMNRHVCRFVRVKSGSHDGWVWEHPGVIVDEIRQTGEGAKTQMKSLTLTVLEVGAEVDVVTSDATGGGHRAKRVDSFVYDGEDLVRTNTRRITPREHR